MRFDISCLIYVLRYVKIVLVPIKSSVAKCRGSWVVGRGRGSWVWGSVVGKNKIIVAKFREKISGML